MPDNTQTAMFEILKRIQLDVSEVKTDMSGLKTEVAELKGRVGSLETLVRKQGRDSAAMLVMMRGTVGVFDERLKDIEEDVRQVMERG